MLESAQSAARSSAPGEPGPAYWENFSNRVMQRIGAKSESPVMSRWDKLAAKFVPARGRRLGVAAGLASIALAIAVGALFIERQAERAIPPIARAPAESLEAPKIAAKELPTPPLQEERVEGSAAGKREALPAAGDERVKATKETGAQDFATAPTPVRENRVVEKQTESASEDKVVAQKNTDRDDEAPSAGSPPGATGTAGTESIAGDRQVQAQSSKMKTNHLAIQSTVARSPEGSFQIGGAVVQKISDEDSLVSDDSLRAVISAWQTQMKADPTDSLANEGYRQIAIAYGLLARRPGNEAAAAEGARVIRAFLDRAEDPLIKEFLAAKLVEIERFTNP
jgi:hypothetical protein